MKFLVAVVATVFGLVNAHPTAGIEGRAPAGTPGMDVSGWQGDVDWATAKANGAQFAYIKVDLLVYHIERSNTLLGN